MVPWGPIGKVGTLSLLMKRKDEHCVNTVETKWRVRRTTLTDFTNKCHQPYQAFFTTCNCVVATPRKLHCQHQRRVDQLCRPCAHVCGPLNWMVVGQRRKVTEVDTVTTAREHGHERRKDGSTCAEVNKAEGNHRRPKEERENDGRHLETIEGASERDRHTPQQGLVRHDKHCFTSRSNCRVLVSLCTVLLRLSASREVHLPTKVNVEKGWLRSLPPPPPSRQLALCECDLQAPPTGVPQNPQPTTGSAAEDPSAGPPKHDHLATHRRRPPPPNQHNQGPFRPTPP